jgi:hypothetical protein
MLSRREITEIQEEQLKMCHRCIFWDAIKGCPDVFVAGQVKITSCQTYNPKPEGEGKLKCRHHPRYGGKIKPKVSCDVCWKIYLDRN